MFKLGLFVSEGGEQWHIYQTIKQCLCNVNSIMHNVMVFLKGNFVSPCKDLAMQVLFLCSELAAMFAKGDTVKKHVIE